MAVFQLYLHDRNIYSANAVKKKLASTSVSLCKSPNANQLYTYETTTVRHTIHISSRTNHKNVNEEKQPGHDLRSRSQGATALRQVSAYPSCQ